MLGHILNGIRSLGRKAAPSLITREPGRGTGARQARWFALYPWSFCRLSPVRASLLMSVLTVIFQVVSSASFFSHFARVRHSIYSFLNMPFVPLRRFLFQ